MFAVLYRWRVILAGALILMVLLYGWQAYRVSQGANWLEQEQYKLSLSEYERQVQTAQSSLDLARQRKAEREEYQALSLRTQIDYQYQWTARKRYVVRLSEGEEGGSASQLQNPLTPLLNMYTSLLSSTSLPEEERLALIDRAAPRYWADVVSVGADTEGGQLIVSVIGPDQAFVEKLMDYMAQKVLGTAQGEAAAILPHTIREISSEVNEAINTSLLEEQNALSAAIRAYQEAMDEAQAELNRLRDQKASVQPGSHKTRYAAIGLALGALLTCVYFALRYIFSGRLREAADVSERYDLPLLGQVASSSPARRSGRGLDGWLERKARGAQSAENPYARIAEQLKPRCEGKRVVLTGSVGSDKLNQVSEELAGRVPNAAQWIVLPDITQSAETVRGVAQADGVILVEEIGVSIERRIDLEVEQLLVAHAEMLGCVII
ncbi:MAG: hypothetical protein IJ240_00030 [Clostridia bacterium]|nr:hypothetical protein [Clostridia bacterium]